VTVHYIRRRPPSGAALRLLALCLGSAGGCDFPTDVPDWDTRWVIPAETTSLSVAELLPSDVAVAAGGASFDVPLSAITLSRTLREMCAACAMADGLTAPKPPFTVSFGGDLPLPEALLSAQLAGGAVEFRLRHDFPFDPLRPSSASRGYLILEVRSGSTVLARDSLDGSTTALTPGTTVTRTLQLGSEVISEPLQVGITLSSPAGDPVTIDADDRLVLEVPATRIQLADARVRVVDRSIATPQIVLELAQIESTVTDRVRGGAVQLDIDNPFEITGSFELRIDTPVAQIAKPLDIAPGESTVRVELTAEELKAMLGHDDVRLGITGLASSPPSGTPVEPTDEIRLGARLELVVATGRS
jgi:hypothetical protein